MRNSRWFSHCLFLLFEIQLQDDSEAQKLQNLILYIKDATRSLCLKKNKTHPVPLAAGEQESETPTAEWSCGAQRPLLTPPQTVGSAVCCQLHTCLMIGC